MKLETDRIVFERTGTTLTPLNENGGLSGQRSIDEARETRTITEQWAMSPFLSAITSS